MRPFTKIIVAFLSLGIMAVIVASYFTVTKHPGKNLTLNIGLALSLACSLAALIDICKSVRTRKDKFIWSAGVVFGGFLGIFLYLTVGQRKLNDLHPRQTHS